MRDRIEQGVFRLALGVADRAMDAHHVIPYGLRVHPLVAYASDGGYSINERGNGVALPATPQARQAKARAALPAHIDPQDDPWHSAYSGYVAASLDAVHDWFLDVRAEWHTPRVAARLVRCVAYDLHGIIRRFMVEDGRLELNAIVRYPWDKALRDARRVIREYG